MACKRNSRDVKGMYEGRVDCTCTIQDANGVEIPMAIFPHGKREEDIRILYSSSLPTQSAKLHSMQTEISNELVAICLECRDSEQQWFLL